MKKKKIPEKIQAKVQRFPLHSTQPLNLYSHYRLASRYNWFHISCSFGNLSPSAAFKCRKTSSKTTGCCCYYKHTVQEFSGIEEKKKTSQAKKASPKKKPRRRLFSEDRKENDVIMTKNKQQTPEARLHSREVCDPRRQQGEVLLWRNRRWEKRWERGSFILIS